MKKILSILATIGLTTTTSTTSLISCKKPNIIIKTGVIINQNNHQKIVIEN